MRKYTYMGLKRCLLVIYSLLYLTTSLPGLYVDMLNTDGINWHTRSNNFFNALLNGEFDKTYQSYHPGITLMWISSPFLHLYSNYLQQNNKVPYAYDTYLDLDYVAKISVVVFTLILFVISLDLIMKIFGLKIMVIFATVFVFEPFIIGQRRLYHLDYIMSLTGFLSLLFVMYWRKTATYISNLIKSSFFFILSVLTKSNGILLLPSLLIEISVSRFPLKHKLIGLTAFSAFVSLFSFLLIPALWKDPVHKSKDILNDMYLKVVDIGIHGKKEIGFSGAKSNIILDDFTKNGDFTYYIKSMLFSLSPAVVLILVFSLVKLFVSTAKGRITREEVILFLSMAIILIPMSYANKKGIRYGIVFMPYIILLISISLGSLKIKHLLFLLIFYLVSLIPQYIGIYPYFYAYANPILGGVKARTYTFKPGPLGLGTYAVNEIIKSDAQKSAANYKVSAFKSLKVINPHGVVDTTLNCQNNYIVVYALEKDPSKKCPAKFNLIGTVKVGNLDYWRVYKRL